MRRLRLALCVLVFIGALGLTLYPLVSNYCAEAYQSTAIAAYTANVSSMDDTTLDSARQAAADYNSTIRAVPLDGPDAIALLDRIPPRYDSYMNVNGDGIMGYIRIPAIGITLPIYHGVEAETLEHGAGHLPGSSLPVGGESTHAVIAAHSGLASQRMFTDLEQLKQGDTFYLSVLDETLAYEVDQILVVEPDDASPLSIVPGGDFVTLITCTPYGANTHRLLVRGKRIPYTPAQEETIQAEEEAPTAPSTWREQYVKGLALGFGILAGGGGAVVIAWRIYQTRHPRRRYGRRYGKHEAH